MNLFCWSFDTNNEEVFRYTMERRVLVGVSDSGAHWSRKYLTVLVFFAFRNDAKRWAEFATSCHPVFSKNARAMAAMLRGAKKADDTAACLRVVLEVMEAIEPGSRFELDLDAHRYVTTKKPQWGGLVWFVVHHLAYYSPATAADGVEAASYLIPCDDCRQHFRDMLTRYPYASADDVTPFHWTTCLHNVVSLRIRRPAMRIADE